MPSPLIESLENKPGGFDLGLCCLAGVTAWTIAVRIFLPAATHTHNHALLTLAVAADFIGLTILFLSSLIVWLRRNHLRTPPRRWALVFALCWVSGQMVVWLLIASRSRAEGETDLPRQLQLASPQADSDGIVIRTKGARVVLPHGWQVLKQPSEYFVQTRARNVAKDLLVSVGTFHSDMSLEAQVAITIAGAVSLSKEEFERISVITGIPVVQMQRAMETDRGRQMLEKVRQGYAEIDYHLVYAGQNLIKGKTMAYEIRSRVTDHKEGRTRFARQFMFRGLARDELVTVAFLGGSEDVFQDQGLVDAIQIR
jgi:hypothetical protein